MTHQDINIFLTLVDKMNLSKAANSLYMSQSTLSHRLSSLEKELNAPLFIRNKGHRTLTLTPFGHDFIPIAERWTALWAETQDLHTTHGSRTFYIGSVPSLVQYLFADLLKETLITEQQHFRLMIKSMQSAAMYPALENREIDLAFAVKPSIYSNVINTPILNEENLLILSSKEKTEPGTFGPDIHPLELNPENELIFQFHQNYLQWRTQWFGYFANPAMGCAEASLIERFFSKPCDFWCVAPFSVALAIQQNCCVSLHHFTSPPLPRTCYLLTHRIPRAGYESSFEIFQNHLYQYLRNEESLGHLQLLI